LIINPPCYTSFKRIKLYILEIGKFPLEKRVLFEWYIHPSGIIRLYHDNTV
jgi:hypothetical protein